VIDSVALRQGVRRVALTLDLNLSTYYREARWPRIGSAGSSWWRSLLATAVWTMRPGAPAAAKRRRGASSSAGPQCVTEVNLSPGGASEPKASEIVQVQAPPAHRSGRPSVVRSWPPVGGPPQPPHRRESAKFIGLADPAKPGTVRF
jgi:hypothetical protein